MSETAIIRRADKTQLAGHVPVTVLISGTAIIATRCLGLLLLSVDLGPEGIRSFIETSTRSWDMTLLCLASLGMLCLELRCGFVLLTGRNWARWCFLFCQLSGGGYLFFASWQGFYPEMFAMAGDSAAQIVCQLLAHKLPDILMIGLLFAPITSRRFFLGIG